MTRIRGLAAVVLARASTVAMVIAIKTLFGHSSGSASTTALLRKRIDLSSAPYAIASASGEIELLRVPRDDPDFIVDLPDGYTSVADDFNTLIAVGLPAAEFTTSTLGDQEFITSMPAGEVTT